jgi:para-aminobenzoate synthetase component 1
MFKLAELEYVPDSARRFAALKDSSWPVLLDSGPQGANGGRYDILTAGPYATLTTWGDTTVIQRRGRTGRSRADPLRLLAEQLGEQAQSLPSFLPFAGGAVGYFAYDLARRLEPRLPLHAAADIEFPDMAVGLYDWAIVVDHEERRCWVASHGRDPATAEGWDALVSRLSRIGHGRPSEPFRILSPVVSDFDRAAYRRAFERIQAHIGAGDCYQVNLAQRFEARAHGDPWRAYLSLRETNPAPFSAFARYPFGAVLSSSPERFLRVRGRAVQTKPIKGTRPRASDPQRDRALAAALRSSQKDRAENVMIVDLLRNDLGRVCEPGSVRVDSLFDIESFATVHQLVSTVSGRLAVGRGPLDLLRACFPGGSITGAPKLRAMQIIENVEPHRRCVYCGSIGYIGFDGNVDTNIAIRTLLKAGDSVYAWAGGGIVADSDADGEYQESLDKAAALLAVLNDSLSTVAG